MPPNTTPNTLSFVHHTSSARDLDDETKKLVRSQAMIDFRRRQREEKRRKSSSREPDPERSISVDGGSDHGSTTSALQALENDPPATPGFFKFSIKDAPDSAPTRVIRQPRSDLPRLLSTRSRRKARSSISNTDGTRIPGTQPSELEPIHSPGSECPASISQESSGHLRISVPQDQADPQMENYQPAGSTTPPTFHTIDANVKTHVRFLQQSFILLNTESATTTLLPDQLIERTTDESCLFSAWILSNAHMNAYMNVPINDFPHLQAVVYRNLNARLANSMEDALAMSTIGSIVVMCLLEILRGTRKADVHLDGLVKIVALHGGMDAVEDFRLKRLLLMIDILNSSTTFHTARFSTTDSPNLRNHSQPPTSASYFTSSPLLTHEPFSSLHLHNSRFATPETIQLLETTFASIEVLQQTQRTAFARTAAISSARSDRLWEPPSTDDPAGSNPDAIIAKAVQLTARMHARAVTLGTGYHDPANADDLDALYEILRHVDLEAWKGLPWIYLWVLLTAHAASNPTHYTSNRTSFRSLLSSELCRLGLSIGLHDSFDIFMQTVRNFVWVRNSLARQTTASETQYPFGHDLGFQ